MKRWDWRLYGRGIAGILIGELAGALIALALRVDPWTGYTVGGVLALAIFAVAVYRRRGTQPR